MKVSFLLANLDMTGGNRVLSIYANMLRSHGHDVSVIVPGPALQHWFSRFWSFVLGKGFGAKLRPRPSHFDGLEVNVTELTVPGRIFDADVPDGDIVIATWWETAEWAYRLSPSKGARVYLIQHHETFDYLPYKRSKATYTLPFHKIVVAPWLKQVMQDEYGDDNVDLVPNAVDHQIFYSAPRSKRRLPTVGFMYSPAGFKVIGLAIDVLRQLKVQIPTLRVVSFGQVKPVGLDFLGSDLDFYLCPSQQLIRECYSSCDAWLSTSRSEGFNLPALEAMACRTPVVSTRTGWPATAILDGYNGYGAPIGDGAALLSGLRKILESPDWTTMSDQAFATAEPLTWDHSYNLLVTSLERAATIYSARHLQEKLDV